MSAAPPLLFQRAEPHGIIWEFGILLKDNSTMLLGVLIFIGISNGTPSGVCSENILMSADWSLGSYGLRLAPAPWTTISVPTD